jgi:saccharopine dehydrogenase-like NADP-dependent oxidoreductase
MMKKILVFGAGKSATSLIEYLCLACTENNWILTVCDADIELAESKINNCKNAIAVSVDVIDPAKRIDLITAANIVISMLPPQLHSLVANDCVDASKHLLTASYIDKNIKKLSKQIEEKELLFLCEMGLDPGIDHMSAMKIINEIKNKGGQITSFISHCGGLISPESDDNPWHYKITWNPGNIVMAGSSGAVYKSENKIIEIPYKNVFNDCKEVDVHGLHSFAWYPNRDSLSYIDTYKLHNVTTFIRTTLRHPPFCRGWNKIINMGLTDLNDYDEIKNCKTYSEWYQFKKSRSSFVIYDDLYKEEFENQINFLGVTSNEAIEPEIKNSALLLQSLLEKKLAMQHHDKDMILMLNEID